MAVLNITFKNEKHGKLHATILHNDVWYSVKDICRLLNLPNETIVRKLVQNKDQTEYTNFEDDWSINRRDLLVNTSGMLDLLKHGRNEAVSNWFNFFVGEKSDSIAEQLESFGNDNCKISILYEG